jgi:hypothetical protein
MTTDIGPPVAEPPEAEQRDLLLCIRLVTSLLISRGRSPAPATAWAAAIAYGRAKKWESIIGTRRGWVVTRLVVVIMAV